MGKSGVIGKKLAGTLASTGSPAFFLHPAEAGHGDLGMLVEGDVLIAISHSGGTKEVVALLPTVKRLGIPLISMVGDTDSVLAREADVVVDAGIEKEACPLGLVPTASSTAALAMGDALAMALLDERGYSADDFAAVHPRGGIGQRLLRVRQIMHREADVPRISASDELASVVAEMSGKGLGMTSVVDDGGALVGIITDGDLRRLLQRGPEALAGKARDFMSLDPICVGADALAAEALRLMEEGKITSLMVVDQDGRPEGVVHLHDLWRTQMI
jgi:arabinose-5-phosphate isomerase